MSMILGTVAGTVSRRRATMSTTVFKEAEAGDCDNDDYFKKQLATIEKRDEHLYANGDDNNEALKADLKKSFDNNIVKVQTVNLFEIARQNAQFQLVDIPGLNDSSTKDVYFEHLEDIFSRLSMIMLVFDINGAMNTSDEMDILRKTVELAKKTNEETGIVQKLYIIANKCDEMVYCEESKTLKFVEKEYTQLFDQLSEKVENIVEEVFPDLSFELVRISAEDGFIYNTCKRNLAAGKPTTDGLDDKYLDKLGVAECGKKQWNHLKEAEKREKLKDTLTTENINKSLLESGYTLFQAELSEHLTPSQQYTYLLNNLKLYLNQAVLNMDATMLYKVLCSESEKVENISESDYISAFIPEIQFIPRLMKICRKHAEFLENFQEGTPSEFLEPIAPLLTKIKTAMNSDRTALNGFVPTTSTLSEPIHQIESKLYSLLVLLRNLEKRADDIYKSHNPFGLSSLIDHVRNALASYYTKLVECDREDYNLIMELIRTKMPYVDSDYDLNDAVKTLFEKNKTLVYAAPISHLSAKVIPFLVEMCETGIVTIDERNQILFSFIIRVYDNINVNPEGFGALAREKISVNNVIYLQSAQWVLKSACEQYYIYKTFYKHLALLNNIMSCMNTRMYSDELNDIPIVLPHETMEHVCVKWHEAFKEHSSNEKKRSSSSSGMETSSRVTRSKKSM